MKIKKKQDDQIKLEMTPMIDVTFQLLTFFIMTFKVVPDEGDFNIKMPLGGAGVPDVSSLGPLNVKLVAGANGDLAQIKMGDRALASFDALQAEVMKMVGTPVPGKPSEKEAEIDADYDLKYEHVMSAITAVAGRKDSAGNVIRLIEKVKFAKPSGKGG